MVVRGELTSSRTFPARYVNTCWSLNEAKDGKIAAVETFVSKTGETADLRKQNQEENVGWYAGITADIFA